MASKSSRILIIGSTGHIGRYIAKASIAFGHPTFLLVRESTINSLKSEKAKLLESFESAGANILHGSMEDHASLVEAIKKVDVVISAVGIEQLMSQMNIIKAIKEVGTVKRFLPSEYGFDYDRVHAVEPAKSMFDNTVKVRRAIEAEAIPYTYVTSNCFAGYYLPSLGQLGIAVPPRDIVVILGDGNTKAIFVKEEDVATFTIRAADNPRALCMVVNSFCHEHAAIFVKEEDVATFTIRAADNPRALNKSLYLMLPGNDYSINELVSLWEKKIGKALEKLHISEEELLKKIAETPFPNNLDMALCHSAFVKGDQTKLEIGPAVVEASRLYPDVKYTTVEEYLNQYV